MKANAPMADLNFSDDIFMIDLPTGKVSILGTMPSAIASHVSLLVDDKFLVLYGGTNGYKFFDSILRYSFEKKEW